MARDAFQAMLLFPWSAGAELTNEDQTEWTLDSPEWVEAMTYYQSFFAEGIANPNPDTGAGAAGVRVRGRFGSDVRRRAQRNQRDR